MNSVEFLLGGSILLVILLLISLLHKEKTDVERSFLFWTIAIVSVLVTMHLIISTVTENINSVTKGPVHWHADFEIYYCGEKQDLLDPKGLTNRIGNPLFHEHGDDRIHIEGTVHKYEDVNLTNFFRVIGGELTLEKLTIPTNTGNQSMENGQSCPNGEEGMLQVFVYKTQKENKTVTQEKLINFMEYVPSPESVIPPGDCVIIEFGEEKKKTDKLCNFYKIDINSGALKLSE